MEKIIFGITSLTLGGAERVLVDIVNKLVEKFDITIFTIYSKGELETELDSRIHLESLYDKKYTELSKMQKILIPLSVLFNRKKIFKKYVDLERCIAQISFLEGPITRIFSTKTKKAVNKIAWIHNDISKVFGKGVKAELKRRFDRSIYERYNNLIFVSIDNLDKFNKVYDDIALPHEKVIHNYINADRILELSKNKSNYVNIFNSNETNIIQISRLTKQKAIERLIDVHAKLIKEEIPHHIYIIGDGPLRAKLQKKIEENNVQKTFTLLGAKKNPYPYVKDADAFSLFSNFEGYPMVVEEAKILNKFIAVTNTASREVLIDYPYSSLIVENSEEGIEEAIKYIVQNKEKISKENLNYVYENDKIIDKIVRVIKNK